MQTIKDEIEVFFLRRGSLVSMYLQSSNIIPSISEDYGFEEFSFLQDKVQYHWEI